MQVPNFTQFNKSALNSFSKNSTPIDQSWCRWYTFRRPTGVREEMWSHGWESTGANSTVHPPLKRSSSGFRCHGNDYSHRRSNRRELGRTSHLGHRPPGQAVLDRRKDSGGILSFPRRARPGNSTCPGLRPLL